MLTVSVDIQNKQVSELDNELKLVRDFVNNKEAQMLRDTGRSTICISTMFADQLNMTSQEEKWISLTNGSEC